jgi:hypothetical protein
VAEQEEHRQHEHERSRCGPPPARTYHPAQLTGRRIFLSRLPRAPCTAGVHTVEVRAFMPGPRCTRRGSR